MKGIKDAHRIVVKVGTSTLTYDTGKVNLRRMDKLAQVISDLRNSGTEVALVTSAAIAVGVGKLGLSERPGDIPSRQAVATVGQCELMDTYDRLFSGYHHTVAQILLTGSDIKNEQRRKNFHNTLFRLLELGVLPVINENDTIATEEIVIGDNDTLGAVVAVSASADLLILLSDIDGLYDRDPRRHADAHLISVVERVDDDLYTLAEDSSTGLGTGGMVTKLRAAAIATAAGCEMVIANGSKPEVLYDIAEGRPVGTRFLTGRAVI